MGRDIIRVDALGDVELSKAMQRRLAELIDAIVKNVISGSDPLAALDRGNTNIYSKAGREHWRGVIENACLSQIKRHCDLILRASSAKFSIRDVQVRAKAIMASAESVVREERSRMRKELATEINGARKRLSLCKKEWEVLQSMLDAKHKRRFDADGVRKAHADQIQVARTRLAELRRQANEARLLLAQMQEKRDALACEIERFDRWRQYVAGNARFEAGYGYGELYERVPQPNPNLIPSKEGDGLPHTSGIYFLWLDGRVDYVGKSSRLSGRLRLGSHHVLSEAHRISYVYVEHDLLDWAEPWYIGLCRPNKNLGTYNPLRLRTGACSEKRRLE